jgi:hypothetical protein
MSSLLAGAVWSASSDVSIDVLRRLVYAIDVHKCQLRRVLRVGGQNGAGRVRKVGGVVSNGVGVGYGQDALAVPRASPEIKETYKRTSTDGDFGYYGWVRLATRRGKIQICWQESVTGAIQI